MATKFITVPPGMLESLFPFHIGFDKDGLIVSAGTSVSQKCSEISGKSIISTRIDDLFYCSSPKIKLSHDEIKKHLQSHFLLQHKLHSCQLRGQFIYVPDDDLMLFLGSPWLTSTYQLEELCFDFSSFALHDTTLDMLHVFQSSLNAINDAHVLAEKIKKKNIKLYEQTERLDGILSALEWLQEAVFIFKVDDRQITYANISACKLVSASKERLIGSSFLYITEIFLEERLKEDLNHFLSQDLSVSAVGPKKSTAFGEGIWECRSLIEKQDGQQVCIYEISFQPLEYVDGVRSIIATLRDVTQQVKADRDSRRNERLESLGKLAGGIAHDLNNALAPISLSIGSLQRIYPKESEILELMQISTKRAADMVRQLLTFAKGIEGDRVSIKIQNLIYEISQLIRGSFPKNIVLNINCDANLPPFLADVTQVHQILLNLCVNARDAMAGGGMLTIKAFLMHVDEAYAAQISAIENVRPGRYMALQVQDTGTGIPPEIVDKIFDPFFTTKSPDQGTGLGLSTVMGIVRSHGGFMQVQSSVGKGTTFTVHLPASEEGQPNQDITAAVDCEFCGHGELVLIVDDEHNVREATRMLLGQLNLAPITAEDGTDGLIHIAEHRADLRLIITDIHMPNMDGLQFALAARRVLPKIPIIVCSGKMEDHVEVKLNQIAGVHRLNKPFNESQLIRVIKDALEPIQSDAFSVV